MHSKTTTELEDLNKDVATIRAFLDSTVEEPDSKTKDAIISVVERFLGTQVRIAGALEDLYSLMYFKENPDELAASVANQA